MATLTKAHNELFRRTPNDCFPALESLYQKCADDLWSRPRKIVQLADDRAALDTKIGSLLALVV